MRLTLYGLVFAFAALSMQPVWAMQVRMAYLFTPGVELIKPAQNWPMNTMNAALKEKLAAYKGKYAEDLSAFYALNDYRPLWTDDGRWLPRARDLIARLSNSRYDGLEPKDYLKAAFLMLDAGRVDEKIQADADVELSASAVGFIRNLSSGRIDPSSVRVHAKPEFIPVRQILEDMSKAPDIDAQVAKYEPQHEGYRALHAALAKTLDGASHVAQKPFIPNGPVLSEGMKDERVPVLRARFALNTSSDAPQVMDSELVKAVRVFQEQNGLKATGALSKGTVRLLNEQAETRDKDKGGIPASDLIVNMERWRWLPHELGVLNVTVNIPEFLVRVNKDNKTAYEGRVVVGKQNTPTPIFSDRIEYIVVNPSWNIPPSIVRNEMLPMLQEDPEAFMRRGYEVRQDRNGNLSFRQPPSARNALGRIKFIFPNDQDVYLHDTPAKGYFERSMRAFSHGCVRVDKPLNFADALLVNEPKLNGKILGRMFGDGERFINLQKFIPVHLVYFTAFAGEDGAIEHRPDIYGIDSRLKAALNLSRRG